ncbi:fumarate hydratase [Cupriavidus basilensis]
MTVIFQEDVVDTIADALQYVSYYHPADFVQALKRAFAAEPAGAARDAIEQLLVNSRMSAQAHRPICQDTGVGAGLHDGGHERAVCRARRRSCWIPVQQMVDAAVRRGYTDSANPLRATMVGPALGERRNTGDNTPGFLQLELVPGNTVTMTVAAKGRRG